MEKVGYTRFNGSQPTENQPEKVKGTPKTSLHPFTFFNTIKTKEGILNHKLMNNKQISPFLLYMSAKQQCGFVNQQRSTQRRSTTTTTSHSATTPALFCYRNSVTVTLPSRLTWRSFCASTANSIGSLSMTSLA